MIAEKEFVNALMECKNDENLASFKDISDKLGVALGGTELLDAVNTLTAKGYISTTTTHVQINPSLLKIYNS